MRWYAPSRSAGPNGRAAWRVRRVRQWLMTPDLPKPEHGTAAFDFDGVEESTYAQTQYLGQIFSRPHWRREGQG
jgi:hypothetical protein